MSHLVLARIWHIIVGRPDISNALLEIIGQFSLRTINTTFQRRRYLSFELLVWLKVVFDAQRVLVQDKSLLIDSQLLLTLIDLVIDLRRANWDESQAGLDDDSLEWRTFFGPVLLSGVRAFHLREELISEERRGDLLKKLHGWKAHSADSPEIIFVQACREAIKEMPVHKDEFEGLRNFSTDLLPDWNTFKLCPTIQMKDKFIEVLSHPVNSLTRQQFWALYDILGVVESAYISRCGPDEEEYPNAQSVAGIRKSILERLEIVRDNDENILVLKNAALYWCRDGCDCISTSSDISVWSTFHNNQSKSKAVQVLNEYPHLPMEKELYRMFRFLQYRVQEITHAEFTIRRAGAKLFERIQQWRGDPETLRDLDYSTIGIDSPAVVTYIVNCPEQHRIAVPTLEALGVAPPNREELKNFKEVIRFSIRPDCPKCSDRESISRADRVTPLDATWSEIRKEEIEALPRPQVSLLAKHSDTISANTASTSTNYASTPPKQSSPSDSNDSKRSSCSTPTIPHPQDGVPSPKQTKTRRQSTFSVLSRSSNAESSKDATTKKYVQANSYNRYCFSADGCTLLLWEKELADIFVCDISTLARRNGKDSRLHISASRLAVGNVLYVCAGLNKIACVSGTAREASDHSLRRVTIFNKPTLEEQGSGTLVNPGHGAFGPCAISRNDKFFAVLWGAKLLIYEMDSLVEGERGVEFKTPVQLNCGAGGYQMINFSADSLQIIVATMNTNDNDPMIHLEVVNLRGEPVMYKHLKISQEAVLKSVHIFPTYEIAFVGVLADHHYHVLHSTQSLKGLALGKEVHNIQSAASSQNGQYVVVALRDGKLWRLDVSDPRGKALELGNIGCRNPPSRRALEMSMSNDHMVRGFWRDQKGYHIFQVRVDSKDFSESVVQVVDGDVVDPVRTRTSSTVGT